METEALRVANVAYWTLVLAIGYAHQCFAPGVPFASTVRNAGFAF